MSFSCLPHFLNNGSDVRSVRKKKKKVNDVQLRHSFILMERVWPLGLPSDNDYCRLFTLASDTGHADGIPHSINKRHSVSFPFSWNLVVTQPETFFWYLLSLCATSFEQVCRIWLFWVRTLFWGIDVFVGSTLRAFVAETIILKAVRESC